MGGVYMSVIRIAHANGVNRKELFGIANGAPGTPIKDVITDKRRLAQFMGMLNEELERVKISRIDPDGWIKGRILSNRENIDRIDLLTKHKIKENTDKLTRPGISETERSGLLAKIKENIAKLGQLGISETEKEAFPARNGTLVGFAKNGTPLGNEIVWSASGTNYFFKVPEKGGNERYIGQMNALVYVNHDILAHAYADISPEEERHVVKKNTVRYNILMEDTKVMLLHDFHSSEAYREVDEKSGITRGPECSSGNEKAIRLNNYPELKTYVGPLVNGFDGIHLDRDPKSIMGALIEVISTSSKAT